MPHPDTPPNGVEAVRVMVERDADTLLLTFMVEGAEHVALPQWTTSARTDGLWKTTCCELFLAADTGAYVEFNYSPSTQWAAYGFDAYRKGMRDLSLTIAPQIQRGSGRTDYLVHVEQNLSDLPFVPTHMGLSAVIEETDGTKSYWALTHAPGPPDFHNRACFIATLPPPPR